MPQSMIADRPPRAALRPAGRLRGLDALRGLAAMSVVLYHYGWGFRNYAGPSSPPQLLVFHPGHLGVELFFIISGFVILRTLERSQGLADFVVSRFSRLYPAYVACSLLTCGLIVADRYNPFGLSLRDALLNVFMISDLIGVREISYSYWTLQCELLFYVAAAAVYLGLRVRRVEIPCLIWLAMMAAGHLAGLDHSHTRLAMLLQVRSANLFVIGMMLHRLVQRPRDRLALATLVCGLLMALFPHWDAPTRLLLPATLLFTFAVWLAARERLGFLCLPPLLFLGDISYSLYLVHEVIGDWVMLRLRAAGWNVNGAEVVAIVLAVALGAAVRYAVERPGQRAIRALWRRVGGAMHRTEPPVLA